MTDISAIVSHSHIQGVMGLTLFEDFIYWTDGKSKSLRRAHKTSGSHAVELLNSWQAIKSVTVYHPLRQPEGENPLYCSFTGFPKVKDSVFKPVIFFF